MKVEEAPEYIEVRWVNGQFAGIYAAGTDLFITSFPGIAYSPEWTTWGPDEPHDERVKKKIIGFRLDHVMRRVRNPVILLNFGDHGEIIFSGWKLELSIEEYAR